MIRLKVLKDINFGGNSFKKGSILIINKELAEKYIQEGLVEEIKEVKKADKKSVVRKKKGLFRKRKR